MVDLQKQVRGLVLSTFSKYFRTMQTGAEPRETLKPHLHPNIQALKTGGRYYRMVLK